jgi:alkanesulfonate monooxygenase SsuD/methylene tetrahydromethanopterin reductase-like flavin-dependent oxidoreductase (luciferase family)
MATGPRTRVPIWVGGASPSSIRRTARFADAWHPINPQVDWVRDTGLPALRAEAERLGRPAPAFAPRIRARLVADDLDETARPVGVGSLGQVLTDIEALAELGAAYIVLDTNADRPQDQPAPRPRLGNPDPDRQDAGWVAEQHALELEVGFGGSISRGRGGGALWP